MKWKCPPDCDDPLHDYGMCPNEEGYETCLVHLIDYLPRKGCPQCNGMIALDL